MRFRWVVYVELKQPAPRPECGLFAPVSVTDLESPSGNIEGGFVRQLVDSLSLHPDVKGDVTIALVDRADMND
ncbi:hypothetical protein [Micromonospora sp. CPCC 206061]|uniref:hypothetical protein n=1 Tax=Micromonospora sp. CPCC 206061 TaxID=3122410 RepID=UPI002FF1E971